MSNADIMTTEYVLSELYELYKYTCKPEKEISREIIKASLDRLLIIIKVQLENLANL